MPHHDSILQTEHLTRIVQGKRLVDDISLQVRRGEVIAIVGSSGAGKSSFLRLLNRLDEPTSGRVLLEGQDYRTIPPQELRRRVGMLMQSPFLFAGTVADNIRFGPSQRGEQVSLETIETLLGQVRLSGYAEKNVQTLSGGEAQRVSLVRALVNRPQVMLFDEPTSALDSSSEREVESLITSLVFQHGIACLIITHDTAQAARISHRIMVIENGRLEQWGL
jgi:putative ABC transport system ATP-binding protein